MDPTKVYQTAWRGLGYWVTELNTSGRDYARCMESSCPGTDLWNYYRGGRDAYKEASHFANSISLPYEKQAQALEKYCQGLRLDHDEEGLSHYERNRREVNKTVLHHFQQEIDALRERFGNEGGDRVS